MKGFIIIISTYIILFLAGFFLLGFQHELVHVQIFKSYGIDSHIEIWGNGWDWVTKAEGNYSNCNAANGCVQSHNMNEVIGYQLIPIYLIIGFIGLFLVSMLYTITQILIKIYEELSSWRDDL